jgi:Tol biopolymer transport system component
VATLDPASRGPRRELPHDARIPRYVRRVLDRGMAEQPARRYASMRELLAALQPPRSTGPIIAAAVGAAAITGVVMYLAMRDTPHVAERWDGADVEHAVPLTSLGATGCAYAPMIDPTGVVVYDRTIGDNVDLYTVPITGGDSRQITRAPDTWEWRAQPGTKPGEVVHLITDRVHSELSKVALLDLATGAESELLTGLVWDATIVNGDLYYSPQSSEGIWIKRGSIERVFSIPGNGQGYLHLGSSPRGDLLSVSNKWINGPRRACVIDIATAVPRCLSLDTVMRPAFGADGDTVYVPTSHGIVRHELATGDETTITPDYAEGGLAIAPDGSSLVYSTCKAHVAIRELATGKVLVEDAAAGGVTIASNGVLAWVRTLPESAVLVMRTLDGRQIELTRPDQGNAGRPRFSPDGRYLAFGMSSLRPGHLPSGIYVVDLQRAGGLRQVTKGDNDQDPILTSDSRIGFTRGTPDGDDHVFTVTIDGTDLAQISESTRTVYGARGKLLLVGGVDSMLWYDPATGQEVPGPPKPEGEIAYASTSPSGNWVVYSVGSEGEDLWRVASDGGALEHVRRFTADQYVLQPAIDDAGRIVIPSGPYAGDLVKIPARDGYKF